MVHPGRILENKQEKESKYNSRAVKMMNKCLNKN